MLFSSRVAENANRRSRLIFHTPPHVPAPSGERWTETESNDSMPDLSRLPSWMDNREDPFVPDVSILPLKIPNPSASLASPSDSDPMSDAMPSTPRSSTSKEVNADSHKAGTSTHLPGPDDAERCSGFTSHASETERATGSVETPDIRSLPRRDGPNVSGISPVSPMPAMLLAGSNTMPGLSAVANGILVNRIPNGMDKDGAVTVSVALPGSLVRTRSSLIRTEERCTSCNSPSLSNVGVPQASSGLFSEDSVAHDRDDVPDLSSASDVRLNEDGNDADDERLEARSQIEVQSEDETNIKESCAPKYLAMRNNGSARMRRKDTGNGVAALPAPRPLSHPRKYRRPSASACPRSIHHSFLSTQRYPMLERTTQSERGRSRSLIPGASGTESEYPATDCSDNIERSEKEKVHLVGVARQAQEEQASSVESHHAVHETQNEDAFGLVSAPPSRPDEANPKGQQERKRNRRLKSVMSKIREFKRLNKGRSSN